MIIKNQIKQNYTTIPNDIITDTSISHEAFRIYCYIASKPEVWEVVHADVQTQLEIKSHNSLAKYFRELINAGWVSRIRKVSQGNKLNGGYIYTLHCEKQTFIPYDKKPACGKDDTSKNQQTEAQKTPYDKKPACGKDDTTVCQNQPYAQNLSSNNTEIDNIDNNKCSNTDFFKNSDVLNSVLATYSQALSICDKNALHELIEFKRTDDVIVIRSLIKQALKFKLERPNNHNIVSEAVDLCISTNDRNARFVLPHLVFTAKPTPANCNSQNFDRAF